MSPDRSDRTPVPETGRLAATWRGDLVFSAAVAVLAALLVLRVFPELLQGQLIDTDSYMRLVRVRRLMGPGGWFDGTIPRSNAPFGETLHWTRPVDVLIVLGAWIGRPLLGPEQALHISGVLLTPVLLIGVCLATAWAVRPLVGPGLRYFAMLAVLAQVGIMGYALPGRADHNMLILLAFTAMLGSTLRLLMWPAPRRYAWAAGAWAGLGLWFSSEFVVPLFALLAALAVLWVWRGELAAGARSVALALLLMVAFAVALEHPPHALLNAEYDRISVVHLLVAVLVAAFWAAPPALRLKRWGRATYTVIGAAMAVAVMLLLYPKFFGGPMVDVDPELKRTWLPLVTEVQPYLLPHGVAGIGRIIAYLGPALLALGVAVHGLRRDRQTPLERAWVFLGLALIVFIPFGIRWVRFVMYAEILGVLGTIFLLARTQERFRTRGARAPIRALVTAGLLVGPLLAGAGIMALGGESGDALQEAATTQVEACPTNALVSILDDPDGLGASPHTILTHIDLGPTLLYRTPHSVIATPYHRNAQGILDWRRAMVSRDMDEVRDIVTGRGIDLVVACGFDPTLENDPAARGSFALRLQTGEVPDWLTPLPLPDRVSGLRIYAVTLPSPTP